MANKQKYLEMQKFFYKEQAAEWSINHQDPIVGSYNKHNNWAHWEHLLFDNIETNDMTALEYGCGVGRNIIKFKDLFKQIDGVDISKHVIEKANINLENNNISKSFYNLYINDGEKINLKKNTYDLVFSVICLQHICCHEIRYNIMKEIFKILKPNGIFSFQMGYGKRGGNSTDYYANKYDAKSTNGKADVEILDKNFLFDDLKKIGYKKITYKLIDPSCDAHKKWIFVRTYKDN